MAIASLTVSLVLCCFGLNGLVGIVLGLIALRQIRKHPQELTGRSLAIAGVVVSVGSLLLALGFWASLSSRYFELKPIAQDVTLDIQLGDLAEARTHFARSVREEPDFDQQLAQLREYLNRRGQLLELRTGYSINITLGQTEVVFTGIFANGTARLTCIFVWEEGQWRLLGYNVV